MVSELIMNSGEEALWLPSRWKCLHYALLFFSFHRVLDCFGDFGRFSGFIIKLFIFLFYIHQFHVPSSFFFWCLVQSGLFLFLKLAFLCYSSTALAGGYSCVIPPPPLIKLFQYSVWGAVKSSGSQTFTHFNEP